MSSTYIGIGDISYIKVTDSGVEIKKGGSLWLGTNKSNVTIPYNQITGVALVQPGLLTIGYIEIKFPGNNFDNTDVGSDISKNPYCYTLNKKEYYDAVEMKKIIESKMADSRNASTAKSSADEIRKYKKLLDDGIITQKEFEMKKKELLQL